MYVKFFNLLIFFVQFQKPIGPMFLVWLQIKIIKRLKNKLNRFPDFIQNSPRDRCVVIAAARRIQECESYFQTNSRLARLCLAGLVWCGCLAWPLCFGQLLLARWLLQHLDEERCVPAMMRECEIAYRTARTWTWVHTVEYWFPKVFMVAKCSYYTLNWIGFENNNNRQLPSDGFQRISLEKVIKL